MLKDIFILELSLLYLSVHPQPDFDLVPLS